MAPTLTPAPELPLVDVRAEVTPRWPFRLPLRSGADGLQRRRGATVERLLHIEGQPVHVRVCQPSHDRVLFSARAAHRAPALAAISRMRFALGADEDLRDFHRRFARDPLIGRSVTTRPWLRIQRRPAPFEALAWAICEQLIEYVAAARIERRIVWRLGQHCPRTLLRDAPAPAAVAGTTPALLESFGLAHRRALTLRHVAREISRGRIDLEDDDQERALRRLGAIVGIGPWTLAMVALAGLGRYDLVPAGDVNLLKLTGRLLAGGDPKGFATEQQVHTQFAPYGAWAGLAAIHFMTAPALARPDDRRLPYAARRGRPSARPSYTGGA